MIACSHLSSSQWVSCLCLRQNGLCLFGRWSWILGFENICVGRKFDNRNGCTIVGVFTHVVKKSYILSNEYVNDIRLRLNAATVVSRGS